MTIAEATATRILAMAIVFLVDHPCRESLRPPVGPLAIISFLCLVGNISDRRGPVEPRHQLRRKAIGSRGSAGELIHEPDPAHSTGSGYESQTLEVSPSFVYRNQESVKRPEDRIGWRRIGIRHLTASSVMHCVVIRKYAVVQHSVIGNRS